MAAGGIHLTGERLFSLPFSYFTNSMSFTLIIDFVLILLAIYIYKTSKFIPTKVQAVFEAVYEFLEDIALSMLKPKIWKKLGWFFFILFLYIIFSNYLGLLPGIETILINEKSLIKAHNTDINHTLALGVLTLLFIHGYILFSKGPIKWIKHFFHTDPLLVLPIFIAVGILELALEPVKFFVLGLRLFGNIFAGEVLIASMLNLPLVAVPFMLFELLVGFLQAFVFTALSITYLGLLVKEQH